MKEVKELVEQMSRCIGSLEWRSVGKGVLGMLTLKANQQEGQFLEQKGVEKRRTEEQSQERQNT